VVLLRIFLGCSVEEIASITGVPLRHRQDATAHRKGTNCGAILRSKAIAPRLPRCCGESLLAPGSGPGHGAGRDLAAAQRPDLNLHLAACPACAAHMAAAQRMRQILAEQPRDEQRDRQAVELAMTGLFPPRAARLRYRPAFRLGFALTGLLLVGGIAGATFWRSHRSSSVPVLVPQPSGGTSEVSATPSQPEPRLVAEPDPLSGEPAVQRSSRAQPTAAALFDTRWPCVPRARSRRPLPPTCGCNASIQRRAETRLSFALAGRLLP